MGYPAPSTLRLRPCGSYPIVGSRLRRPIGRRPTTTPDARGGQSRTPVASGPVHRGTLMDHAPSGAEDGPRPVPAAGYQSLRPRAGTDSERWLGCVRSRRMETRSQLCRPHPLPSRNSEKSVSAWFACTSVPTGRLGCHAIESLSRRQVVRARRCWPRGRAVRAQRQCRRKPESVGLWITSPRRQ